MYDTILNSLLQAGYDSKEAETIIQNFLNEQKLLDEIQNYFAEFCKN